MNARNFKLIVHVGAGKTGSSSLQASLKRSQKKLNKKGYVYWGLNFDLAPKIIYDWQEGTASASRVFLSLPLDKACQQLENVIKNNINEAQRQGVHTAIISNESLLRGSKSYIAALEKILNEGVDVNVIAYVRRHDAWSRSAYIQWGLADKVYAGPIKPFSVWRHQKGAQATFHDLLEPWINAFGENVEIRNMDSLQDVVADFAELTGLDASWIEKIRTNETRRPEEIYLRSLFNENFQEKIGAKSFNKVFDVKNINFGLTPVDFMSRLLPSVSELDAVFEEAASDREKLNVLLENKKQPPIDVSPLSERDYLPDEKKLIGVLSQLVVAQAIKLERIEEKMQNLLSKQNSEPYSSEKNPPLGAKEERVESEPVFAISTGRSGSTLVQRLLNCHQDLVVWGEHYGFLNGLAQCYVQMANPDQKLFPHFGINNKGPGLVLPSLSDPSAAIEWVNPWALDEFRQQLRSFMEGYFASRIESGKRWGFKEIRYNNIPVLRMLKELYPRGRFVFIRRDPIEVTRSKVFAFVKEDKWKSLPEAQKKNKIASMLKEVHEHYSVYSTFQERNPGICSIVDYEEITSSPRRVMNDLLIKLDLDPERFNWGLGDQVMNSVITKTKRDDEVMSLIRSVVESVG